VGFLDSLKTIFSGEERTAEYWVYVRCKRCGEPIKTRIDLQNHLSRNDDGEYVVNKTLVGNQRCFERIEVTLYFNSRRELIDQSISRGEFITAEEYLANQG
jgi:hypothetical protein